MWSSPSVAAALLVEQGYDVMGLFMRVGVEAPVEDDDYLAGVGDNSAGGAGAVYLY